MTKGTSNYLVLITRCAKAFNKYNVVSSLSILPKKLMLAALLSNRQNYSDIPIN
jgi:hypothetical protein